MKLKFSIVIPAYREKTINKLLRVLLRQSLPKNAILDKILVVAGGYKKFNFIRDKKIRIIRERYRKGKAFAINLALKKLNSDIVILESGDTLAKKDTIKNLLKPFDNPKIGMVTGRPISMDDPKEFVGFMNNLVWFLHHLISFEKPKAGEVLAFRNIIKKIPVKLATDEAYLESVIQKRGYKIVYASNAIVYNKGPRSVPSFIKQRRRIFTGHLHIRNRYCYSVSTMSIKRIIKALMKYLEISSIKDYKKIFWVFFAIYLEGIVRLLAAVDFYFFKKIPYKWEIIR